jgi:hypothetical protein
MRDQLVMSTPFIDVLHEATEIIKILGLVGGALWTAWTFHKLQKVRSEELQIQKGELEYQEAARQLRATKQAHMSVDIKIEDTASPKSVARRFLYITALLKNEGGHNLDVQFRESTLTVARVLFGENGEQTMAVLHRAGPVVFRKSDVPEPVSQRSLRVGQRRQLAFIVPIHQPGAYFVQFRAWFANRPFEDETTEAKDISTYGAVFEQAFHFITEEPEKGDSQTQKPH